MVHLLKGDCLELMNEIPDKSIDMILCDLPYGITACKWDIVLPFDELWKQYNRIIKDNGAILLFGQEPFSSKLRLSNLDMYKYDLFWQKEKPTNVFLMKKQFGRVIENISVFYKNQPIFNPQMEIRANVTNPVPYKYNCGNSATNVQSGEYKHSKDYNPHLTYPVNILKFNRDSKKGNKSLHPTQKPVKLLEYLITTYTNEYSENGNKTIVLDNCMGSGSTGVACVKTNRDFIGIEIEDEYFNIAKERIRNTFSSYGKERK